MGAPSFGPPCARANPSTHKAIGYRRPTRVREGRTDSRLHRGVSLLCIFQDHRSAVGPEDGDWFEGVG